MSKRPKALRQRLDVSAKSAAPDQALIFEALSDAVTSFGECRLKTPYARLRPVLTREGFYWACTHEEEHRTIVASTIAK